MNDVKMKIIYTIKNIIEENSDIVYNVGVTILILKLIPIKKGA